MSMNLFTDYEDYAPDSWAFITFWGFAPGSSVTFEVDHALNAGKDGIWGTVDDEIAELGGVGHDAWTIVDGGVGDLDGKVNGVIETSWHVNEDDSFGETFLLTATIGDTVVADSFTDAGGKISKVYQHWADNVDQPGGPSWQGDILSDNKSDYFEGEVVPHVFVYEASKSVPLVEGQSYSFNVTYNYYQQNTNAGGFAYMTTFDVSRDPGPLNATNPYIAPTVDSLFVNDGGMQGNFFTVDADITGVSDVTYLGTGTKDGYVTITFTYTGNTTTDGIAEIYYGLYIANPGQVADQGSGPTLGASAWSGGSLQTTVDIGGSGASSVQLAPPAILVGEISGIKFNDLNGDGIKDAGEPVLSGWHIVLDKDDDYNNGFLAETTTAADGTYSFSVTPDADKTDSDNDPYHVYEIQQEGWTQTLPSTDSYVLTVSPTTPQYLNTDFGNRLQVDLSVIKTDATGGDPLTVGNDPDPILIAGLDGYNVLTYTILAKNNSDTTAANNVVVTDTLDSDLTYLSSSSGGSASGNVVTWDLGVLDPGEEVTLTVTVKVKDTAVAVPEDDLLNTVAITSSTPDVDPSNNVNNEPTELSSFTGLAGIAIDKVTNGIDGGTYLVGSPVTWTYTVTNTGTVALPDVVVTDDQGVSVSFEDELEGDGDSQFDPGEVWVYKATGTAVAGEYENIGTATSTFTPAIGDPQFVSDSDPSSYFGADPRIAIEKVTNGADDQVILAGSDITWTYTVTNTGNVALANVTVDDDMLADADDPIYVSGDANTDGLLDLTETWTFEASGTAQAGDYDNTGTATGDWNGNDASASDDSSYFGAAPAVTVDKQINGEDDCFSILAGSELTFTFLVKNTGNVALEGLVVEDSTFGLLGTIDLGVGQEFTFTVDGTAGVDEHTNTVTVDGDFADDVGNSVEVAADDEACYFGADPSIDIEKYVWAGGYDEFGDKVWIDADDPTGPTVASTSGIDPEFLIVVMNDGNVDLTGVVVTDNKGTMDTSDDLEILVGDLAVGATWSTDYALDWKAGQHTNTADATADPYTDDAGNSLTASDSDDANYFGIMPAMVTNSSLCDFGETFNLIFTPDYKLGGGTYKLSDSNPGQFYYNLFDYGNVGETKVYTFEIPYPFVPQGAVPIHVYSGVEIDTSHDGQTCLTPVNEIDNFKLADLVAPPTESDGKVEYTFAVTFTGTNFVYINMHLDFGLEKVSGWLRDGSDNAIDNPNVETLADGERISDNQEFEFSAEIGGVDVVGSDDSIYNDNIFKQIKGMGGMFQRDDAGTEGFDEIAMAGQHLIIKDAKGNLMGDATTDADGWYYAQFMATGKKTTYYVYWDKDGDNQVDPGEMRKQVEMGGSAGKWAEVDWTVDQLGNPLVVVEAG